MKLLTLNTHSWMEDNSLEKLEHICEAILRHRFDVIALQEVNQLMTSPNADFSSLETYTAYEGSHSIKQDNFAFLLQQKLAQRGLEYYWAWDASHIGYDRYDEGLAVLSLTPIQEATSFFASETIAYEDYKSRKVVGIKTADTWYFSLHLGWWEDKENPFAAQWKRCSTVFDALKEPVFLLGDFNNPANRKQEGYDLITKNWFDTYQLAEQKDNGITVAEAIDGWTDNQGGLRIDYVFARYPVETVSSTVIFNGINEPIVSDHFGVAVEIKD